MPEFRAESEVERSIDPLYPPSELEFLNQNGVQDPLLFKISELVYRQWQKDKERKNQKKAALLYTIIACCIFFSLMIAFVVAQYFEDEAIINRANTIMNMTFQESKKNESAVPDSASKLSSTSGFSNLLQKFHANVLSAYITNTNSTT